MSLFPKKNLICYFDTIAPSKYLLNSGNWLFLSRLWDTILQTGDDCHTMAARSASNLHRTSRRSVPTPNCSWRTSRPTTSTWPSKIPEKVPGDIAEVGVYKGGSAKIICSAKGDRALHLFDTFAGLPKVDDVDQVWPFYEGKFAASYDKVKAYLAQEKNVFLYKGLFPDTSGPVKDKHFSFVNLDVDTYESTKKCLEFFYPRMSPGGVILSHDYLTVPGVRKAVDDYFADKPEPVVETAASQCIIVKV